MPPSFVLSSAVSHESRTISLRGVAPRLQSLQVDILRVIAEILSSGIIEKGPHGEALAREFQELCGSPHPAVPLDSGSDALVAALLAAEVGPGDEVLVPELSFISTAYAINLVGATPVFVDIAADRTYTLCPDATEAAITTKTKAIIPVHLFGLPVDADAFLHLARRSHLTIIGDAAQAHGAMYLDRYVGNLGFDFETFSLAAVKNIGGWRFGGIVTAREPEMARRLQQISDLGRAPGESYQHSSFGIRANMDEMNAAVIRLQLPHLAEWNTARRRYAAQYDDALSELAPALLPAVRPKDRLSAYWQYALQCESRPLRDRLRSYLHEKGIETGAYPCTLSEQTPYRSGTLAHRVTSRTEAQQAVERLMWLPIYPELEEADRAYLLASIRSFFTERHAPTS